MIHAFKRSRIGFYAVWCIALLLTALIWVRDREYPIFVPIIACALMLGIGFVAAKLLGNILASTENTRQLGYLHVDLNPGKFIRNYQNVPNLVKGAHSAAVCRSYLADGYAAAGEYETAVALLSEGCPAGNLSLEGLYAANLAGYQLALNNPEEARNRLERLEQIIDACRIGKADLARNLSEMLYIHHQHLACLSGDPVDLPGLAAAFEKAQYHLRRLEIRKILALAAIRDQDDAARKEHLSYLRENGGQTVYATWAETLI